MGKPNRTRLSDMLTFMVNNHDGEFDKGGWPYALHPIKVMNLVLERWPDADDSTLIIALGHDLIENTKVTYNDLSTLGCTPEEIAGIKALTKQPGQTEDEYYEGVIQAGFKAIKVKLADITHNSSLSRLKGVTQKDLDRTANYAKRYQQLCDAFLHLQIVPV